MGAGGSKNAGEIAQLAKQAVNYRPPLGPPNPVSFDQRSMRTGDAHSAACALTMHIVPRAHWLSWHTESNRELTKLHLPCAEQPCGLF